MPDALSDLASGSGISPGGSRALILSHEAIWRGLLVEMLNSRFPNCGPSIMTRIMITDNIKHKANGAFAESPRRADSKIAVFTFFRTFWSGSPLDHLDPEVLRGWGLAH